MTTFTELGLAPDLLKALEAEGYTTPTPIQAQAIPSLLAGKDLLGIAQTGTGKTAAFALPILQRLAADRKPAVRGGARALILSPTRELASQIADSFKTYGRHMGFSVATIFGGVGFKPQLQALNRGIDILVATPGRLIDHMTERNAVLSATEILVLDEADQMMDLGFIRPLRQIISKLPSRRQSMFFSATMPHEIGALAAELLRDPVKVAVTPVAKTADRVTQKVIFIEAPKKRALLVELFADPAMTRALVFTRTKRGADKVARHLEVAGIAVSAIHGNKSQGQREAALAAFKASKIRALIATDIAARGIDIDQVSHVVNYELPNIPESYVHRIGRTARAGAEGIAISLCDGEERAYLKDIERLTRQTIPSADRRGDTSLVVPAEDRASRDRDRAPERHEHRGSGRPRNGGNAGQGRGRDQGRDRDRGDRAPTQAGEHARSGNGPRAPWTNQDRNDRPQRDDRPVREGRPQRDDRPQHDGRSHGAPAEGRRDGSGHRSGPPRSADHRHPPRGGHGGQPRRDNAHAASPAREPRRDDRRASEGGGGELRNVGFLAGGHRPAAGDRRSGPRRDGSDSARQNRPHNQSRDRHPQRSRAD